MPREWVRPIHTDNVPTYGSTPCAWTYQAVAGETYYQVKLAPMAEFGKPTAQTPRYEITVKRLDLRKQVEAQRPKKIAGVIRLFTEDAGTELIKSWHTRNARGTVIVARKDVLALVKADRATAAAAEPKAFSPPPPPPAHAFKDEFASRFT